MSDESGDAIEIEQECDDGEQTFSYSFELNPPILTSEFDSNTEDDESDNSASLAFLELVQYVEDSSNSGYDGVKTTCSTVDLTTSSSFTSSVTGNSFVATDATTGLSVSATIDAATPNALKFNVDGTGITYSGACNALALRVSFANDDGENEWDDDKPTASGCSTAGATSGTYNAFSWTTKVSLCPTSGANCVEGTVISVDASTTACSDIWFSFVGLDSYESFAWDPQIKVAKNASPILSPAFFLLFAIVSLNFLLMF